MRIEARYHRPRGSGRWLAGLGAGIATAMLLAGCASEGPRPRPPRGTMPPAAAKAMTPEQQKEKSEALDALQGRLGKLQNELSDLQKQAGNLSGTVTRGLEQKLGDARDALQSLRESSSGKWQQQRDRVQNLLDEADSAYAASQTRLADLQRRGREKESVQAKRAKTGTLVGLDGVPYPTYRASVVERVQQALQEKGLYDGPSDGFLGKETMQAIAQFQKDNGLYVSGIPSPRTRAMLLKG